MRCSIRYWAVPMAFWDPLIVTIRFLVPGANVPFLLIWMLAPDKCCISIKLRPPGPETIIDFQIMSNIRFQMKILPNIAPTITSAISTFFWSFAPKSPGVGLLLRGTSPCPGAPPPVTNPNELLLRLIGATAGERNAVSNASAAKRSSELRVVGDALPKNDHLYYYCI